MLREKWVGLRAQSAAFAVVPEEATLNVSLHRHSTSTPGRLRECRLARCHGVRHVGSPVSRAYRVLRGA